MINGIILMIQVYLMQACQMLSQKQHICSSIGEERKISLNNLHNLARIKLQNQIFELYKLLYNIFRKDILLFYNFNKF